MHVIKICVKYLYTKRCINKINKENAYFLSFSIYTPHNVVEGGILESPWLSVRLSICPWTQFSPELFSYSFAGTALKFIHNVCVHMKLCMCNFHDHTIIVVELSPLELVNFTELLLSREIILQYCIY